MTFGFGPGLLDAVAPDRKPAWLRPLEAFGIDDLGDAYGQTDLLVQIGSDDLMALAHTQRMLLKDARGLAALRWVQDGFLRSYGGGAEGATPRNLFGQVDGTANPSGDALQRAVWGRGRRDRRLASGRNVAGAAPDPHGPGRLGPRGPARTRLRDGAAAGHRAPR